MARTLSSSGIMGAAGSTVGARPLGIEEAGFMIGTIV